MNMQTENIRVYLSTSHACPYLPGQTATSLIIDPALRADHHRLTQLTLNGFRRSGELIYRPHCTDCRACVSVRVPVDQFRPNRAQKRLLRRNADVTVRAVAPTYRQEHFDLYFRYQSSRHPDSDMCDRDPEKYRQFLINHARNTVFFEFYADDELFAVSVVDELMDGLSAVYTFFEPTQSKRGPGTFAILWEIDEVERSGMDWLYLGYWIDACDKMSYKTNFRPIEGFRDGEWHRLP